MSMNASVEKNVKETRRRDAEVKITSLYTKRVSFHE